MCACVCVACTKSINSESKKKTNRNKYIKNKEWITKIVSNDTQNNQPSLKVEIFCETVDEIIDI